MTAEPDSRQSKAEDPLVGLKLGDQFEVIKRLGAGGMGAVYLANQIGMGRNVVIKVMHAELSLNNPVSVERFMREVRAVGSLNHPHIVQVYTFGQTPDGRLYQAMEYIDGKDLCDASAEGPFDQVRALLIIDQVASALTEAHAHGLVHRDLKPENIMVTTRYGGQEWVKVLDFGIAKLHATNAPSLTHTGAIFGTPRYMAPEQIRGEAVDARTDLYALGLILFELVTGAHPFKAETAVDYLYQHMHVEVPSPMEQQPNLHPEVAHLIQRLLAKAPNDRISSAQELRAHIVRLLGDVLKHTSGVVGVSLAQSGVPMTGAHAATPVNPSLTPVPKHTPIITPATTPAHSQPALVSASTNEQLIASPDHSAPTKSKTWMWALGALLLVGGGAAAYVAGSNEDTPISAGVTYVIEPAKPSEPTAQAGVVTDEDEEASDEETEATDDARPEGKAPQLAAVEVPSKDSAADEDESDEEHPSNLDVNVALEPILAANTVAIADEGGDDSEDEDDDENEDGPALSLTETKYINFFLAPASAVLTNKGFPMTLSVPASPEEVGAFFAAHYEDAQDLRGSRFTIRDPSNPWSNVSWTSSNNGTRITVARRSVATSPVVAPTPVEDTYVPSAHPRDRSYRRDSRDRDDNRTYRRDSRDRGNNRDSQRNQTFSDRDDRDHRRASPMNYDNSGAAQEHRQRSDQSDRSNYRQESERIFEQGQKVLEETLSNPQKAVEEKVERFRRRRPQNILGF